MIEEQIKQFSINDIEMFRKDDDVDFVSVKLWALAEGGNSHGNPIDFEILERDADTILGKFIIAKFDRWANDTTTHVPDQQIMGYVLPNQEVKFEEKDGKRFITAYGVISKLYATDVVKALKNGIDSRSVSCEFSCLEGEEDVDGEKPILGFHIHGITILGLSYKPSCAGAELKVMKFVEEISKDSLKTFAEKRTEELKLISHPIDKSKESIDMGDWNGDKVKHDLIKEKNFKTLAKSVCAKLEDGWQERKVTALGYPIMNLKDGKWVYNAEGLSSALAYSAQHDESVHKKVIEIQKKLGLYKEEEMAEEKDLNFSESENDKEEKEIVMEEDKEKEEVAETVEEEKEDESEKEMGCQEEMAEETKKFSLDAYVDAGAILALLEIESEQHRELANKVLKEMSAESIIMEFVAMAKELDGFKEEKAKAEKEKTDKKLFSIMTPAKEKLSVDMFVKLYEEGKTLTFDELDAFTNKIKAFVDENKVSTSEEDGLMMFGASDNTKKEQENIDVFEKLSRKYN